ncbi:MAG: hypothetical protein PVJ19_13020 [Desulfobacteraceae bacterium]
MTAAHVTPTAGSRRGKAVVLRSLAWGARRVPDLLMADRAAGPSPCRTPLLFRHSGFTLVEVTVSILFLGIMVMGISGLYFAAQRSLLDQEHLLPLDSRLRGRMEEIVSRPFVAMTDGSEAITIDGRNYTVTWTVTHPDLDGDTAAEATAKEITVSVDGRSLTTLVIDNQGKIGKI